MRSSYSILRLLKCLVVIVLILSATAGTARAAAGEPGYIMIDGQREFILGWFKLGATTNPPFYQFSHEVLDEGPVHGFDFAMHYSAWPPHGNGIYEYVAEAGNRGMGVMPDMRPPTANFPTLTSMVNWVGHYGTTVPLKDLPGLYGYYLEDEPDGRGLPVGPLVADYAELKAADPDHLIYTSYYLDFAANAAAGYFDATDVAIMGLYTVSRWADVADDVAVSAAEGIGIIAGPWACVLPAKPAFTPEEFKFVVFSAIADGVGGVMPFLFEGWLPDDGPPYGSYNPNFRKDNIYPTTDIVAQIAEELAKGFTGGLSATSAAFEANGGRYVLGGDSERAVLVAVNHGPALASVTFTVSGLSAEIAEVTVLGENRTITLTGPSSNQVVDSFDMLNGVHVYSFRTPCQVLIDDGQGIPSDFNHDCRVNLLDFPDLSEMWGLCDDPNDPNNPCL